MSLTPAKGGTKMSSYKPKSHKMIYEVVQYAERFPDQKDSEILLFVEELFNYDRIDVDSVMGKALIAAYDAQDEEVGLKVLRSYGF
jgi:F0F1-type ATP synthase beta subunit